MSLGAAHLRVSRGALTVLLVAVEVRVRFAVVVDLDVGEDELRQLGLRGRRRPAVQQLLQLLLVQFAGGGWWRRGREGQTCTG